MDRSREKRLTINDIARLAGVSASTVSRVINGGENVSKKTRGKVQRIIQSVDYIPNDVARGLATSSNNTIGLLIPYIMNSYYSELIQSIEQTVRAKGFSLILCITNDDKAREGDYINDMIRRQVRGLLILSTRIDSEALVQRMKKNLAVVAVDADIPRVDCIRVESEAGTYAVVRHLIENGHRKIGFVGYQFELNSLQDRLCGYKRALLENGLEVREDYIVEGEQTSNCGYHMAKKLLSLKDPPTAIQCMNEYCATGVYMGLMERGLRIPEDISVSAFDGLETSKLLVPRLTTAAMPIADMGESAANLLIQNIEAGESVAQKEYLFPAKLFVGGSVRKIG